MPVPQNPSIKITFDGLLVFTFDQTNQFCEIGVLKVQDHVLRINLDTLDPSKKVIHHQEISAEIESGDICIETPERKGYKGVSQFSAPDEDDSENFRWVVDIDKLHNEFHPDGLPLKDGFPPQSIFVRQGLFYTVTQIPVSLVRPDGTSHEIQIASPVGCNLYLNEGDIFVLSYGRSGKRLEITIEAGTTHEITILNTPRNSKHQGHSQSIHFPFFYQFAVLAPPNERFDIVRVPRLGDPRRPCPGILMGRRTTGLTADAPVTQQG